MFYGILPLSLYPSTQFVGNCNSSLGEMNRVVTREAAEISHSQDIYRLLSLVALLFVFLGVAVTSSGRLGTIGIVKWN